MHLGILVAALRLEFGLHVNLAGCCVLILNVKPAVDAHVDDETGHLDFDKANCITRRHILVPYTQH